MLISKCGFKTASCIISTLSAPATLGLGTAAALATCGAAVADCVDAANKFLNQQPIQRPPSAPCPPGQTRNLDGSCQPLDASSTTCPPGQVLDPTQGWGGTCVSKIPEVTPDKKGDRPSFRPAFIPVLTTEQIRWVQAILRSAAGESELKIDGLMGPKTVKAVQSFQRNNKLIVDGVNLQTTTALTQLGLNHIAKQSRVAVDGIMGNQTKLAIKEFQSRYNSGPVDGIVGPITRAAMVKLLLPEIESESSPSRITGELYQQSEESGKWYSLQELH